MHFDRVLAPLFNFPVEKLTSHFHSDQQRQYPACFSGSTNYPTAWKRLKTFVLEDPDKRVISGTKIPIYQIHNFPMWHYENV